MSVTIAAQFDAIEALADELAALATELGAEAEQCRSTVAPLTTALSGTTGERAAAAGAGWGSLVGLLAQQTGALAATLDAAVTSYRLADAALSDRLLSRADTGTR
ncbi:hypothetical protein GCU56_22030 [Geodermatophilus sabuli]|uniref:Uncharacterized protein n=1 Tax=Geodermatophilus sabuli TaxID=1564158 RepID=A0A7K3W6Y7_9ACTN|nr:hypothetical protein [Geodermatophilus sabuli]